MKRLRKLRSGITLIELLVVATIILTLTAISVPSIKPMMESRLTSGAASTVSTFLERARTRAAATGRSCGVVFEFYEGSFDDGGTPGDPSDDFGSASLVIRQVEIPLYYAGLEAGATASVCPGNDVTINGKQMRPLNYNDSYWEKYVLDEASPAIQFDSIGPFYPIYIPRDSEGNRYVDGNGNACYIEKLYGVDLPTRVDAPFKVRRDPRATMTAPIGMPQGTVVDLEYSGTENELFALGFDVTVMFSPSGEIDFISNNGEWTPSDTIYFAIGRWERLSILGGAEDGLYNYEDATNYWISINPRNGAVTTSEVNPPVNYTINDGNAALAESREFARTSKRNLGGH